jgi:hypothetical protein
MAAEPANVVPLVDAGAFPAVTAAAVRAAKGASHLTHTACSASHLSVRYTSPASSHHLNHTPVHLKTVAAHCTVQEQAALM